MGERRDLVATAINQLWRLASGPLVLLMVPLFLDASHQGYWYTIVSLSALAVFADLGFSNIILQFAAHEFASLGMVGHKVIVGDAERIAKLGSLFRFSMSWVFFVNTVALPIVFLVGYLVLVQGALPEVWLLSWVVYLLGSYVNFMATSLLSFLEGCGQISTVQFLRLVASVFYTVALALFLFLGFGLFSLAIAQSLMSLFLLIGTALHYRRTIRQLIFIRGGQAKRWSLEVLPLLGRYALSFASGYFIFQIYTPLAYLHFGSIVAGQVGLTLSLAMAAFSMANVWIYTITPKMNGFVSTQAWSQLDSVFRIRLRRAQATLLTTSVAVILILIWKPLGLAVFDRFLPWSQVVWLFLGWNAQLWINSVAVYMRAHKEEPLMGLSLFSAVWIGGLTWVAAQSLPVGFFFVGFLSGYLWSVPATWLIFKTLKRRLHGGYPIDPPLNPESRSETT